MQVKLYIMIDNLKIMIKFQLNTIAINYSKIHIEQYN